MPGDPSREKSNISLSKSERAGAVQAAYPLRNKLRVNFDSRRKIFGEFFAFIFASLSIIRGICSLFPSRRLMPTHIPRRGKKRFEKRNERRESEGNFHDFNFIHF
jgi:hypothetical protein